MIANELVSRGIDYILQHIDEEISIEDVANHCHFSKYYFSRIFKAETGESIYAFIKRLKMEHSAISIKLEKEKTITDIGIDYGYSSSNYSSAFKKHHHIAPADFRKKPHGTSVPHPFDTDRHDSFQSYEAYALRTQIQECDDLTFLYERYIGNYLDLGKNWSAFTEKYQGWIKEDTLLIERFYHDPAVTGIDQCMYDIGITVDRCCPLSNVSTICGGRFAVYRFDGLIEDIFMSLQGLYTVWLVNSSYRMEESYGLNIYRAVDRENRHVVMDFCIPVK